MDEPGAVDCTVVIPVFNRGEALQRGIDSLRAQSLDPERIEIVYVDDGSNDRYTPATLDAIVARTANARVLHEPASGSPGRPRNVGLLHARGDYVFFADHDDWFDPQALERLVGWARSHESDVVIGKVVAHGRRAAIPRIFRESVAQLPVAEAMISLTPHKLFRRRFLLDHDIRYPEGRRRLEDHHFVAHAYLHARAVSVYADHPCYHHNHAGDDGNFSHSFADPDVYTTSNREVMDLIARHTENNEALRNAMLRRPVEHELLRKASHRLMPQPTAEDTARKHRALRALLLDTVPVAVIEQLGAFPRATAKALRNDDPAAVRRVDDAARSLVLTAELVSLHAEGTVWTLAYRAGLTRDGEPVRFHEVAAGAWQIDESVLRRSDADGPELEGRLRTVDLEVLVASRRTGVQWHLPVSAEASLRVAPRRSLIRRPRRAAALEVAGVATVDLSRVGGEEIGPGTWDVVIRGDILGVSLRSRLAVDHANAAALDLPTTRLDASRASAVVTQTRRTLAVEVTKRRRKA